MAVVELLRVQCRPGRRAEFLARDAAVWTPALAEHDGFISKEVWPSLDDPDQVAIVVRWSSLSQWKCFPADTCADLDVVMDDVQESITCEAYEILEAGATAPISLLPK